jgi:hypothetical protein
VTTRTLPAGRTEPRWPAILALVFVLALVQLLPSRYQFGPSWFPWLVVGIIIAVMLAVTVAPRSVLWHRIERTIVIALFLVVSGMNLLAVGRLVGDMITHRHGYNGITLLESGAVIWTVNVLLFALLYWQLDRAGPEGRAAGSSGVEDFHFAESYVGEEPSGWEPGFVDYLFVAFATSTAFGPPDHARPVSRRAKLMLMLQACISLITLVLIASRAVSTLS